MTQTQLQRKDFSYECNSRGYMITYKGQSIGGGGILNTARGPQGQQIQKQIAQYKKFAETDIQNILNGYPGRIYEEAIDRVNKSEGVAK